MKGDPKVIELLNEALREELTAINQYWLHYRMLDNWGVKKLADYERSESIDEMKHADRLAERILFLDALPNFQALGRLRVGENVEEILKADMEAELQGAKLYRDLIAQAETVRDYVTRDLAREILADEEKHIDFIEPSSKCIHAWAGNYVQLQSKPRDRAADKGARGAIPSARDRAVSYSRIIAASRCGIFSVTLIDFAMIRGLSQPPPTAADWRNALFGCSTAVRLRISHPFLLSSERRAAGNRAPGRSVCSSLAADAFFCFSASPRDPAVARILTLYA